MAKEFLVVGNWKMNLTVHESSLLLHHLDQHIRTYRDVEVVLAPHHLALQPLSLQLDHRKFSLAAQDAFYKDSGPFTGEVSFTMLRHITKYAIIGHSERRLYFSESLAMVRDKVAAAIRNDIIPILCIGETDHQRKNGETKQVVAEQITTALSNLTSEDIDRVVIAYEPVWAISTFGGELARPDDVQKVFTYIRQQVADLYGMEAAKQMRILYGGSVDDQTARGYMTLEGCSGVLVGGASLHYPKFAGIVESAHALARERQAI